MTAVTTAKLTARKVQKIKDFYVVIEARKADMANPETIKWVAVSKGYAHSTSAFAALGRLYQKELLGK